MKKYVSLIMIGLLILLVSGCSRKVDDHLSKTSSSEDGVTEAPGKDISDVSNEDSLDNTNKHSLEDSNEDNLDNTNKHSIDVSNEEGLDNLNEDSLDKDQEENNPYAVKGNENKENDPKEKDQIQAEDRNHKQAGIETEENESNSGMLPLPATNYLTADMLSEAILSEGNLDRLAAVLRKAQQGEEITIGVIGGSITQGSSTSNTKYSYGYMFYQWWKTAFPNGKINYVNAGIGATNSYLGVHRVDQHLLHKKPDVVVVEFSVNDSNTHFYKETYENLVRKILLADHNPAVLLLFMTMEDGTSAQASHLHIGFWYDLPRISYRQMVLKEMEKGTFAWEDISPDNIHPNDRGHAMVGEILWGYMNRVYAKLDTITEEILPEIKEPFTSDAYMDAKILDNQTLTPIKMGSFFEEEIPARFKHGWTTNSGEDGIVFDLEAQNIGIMYYRTIDGMSGQFDVYIDGKYERTLDADFTGGWGNYIETIELYRSKEKKTHRIEIRKSEDSKGDVFSILGFLVS